MGTAHGKETSFVIYDDRLNHSICLLFFYHLQQFVEIFFVGWRTGCLIQLVMQLFYSLGLLDYEENRPSDLSIIVSDTNDIFRKNKKYDFPKC